MKKYLKDLEVELRKLDLSEAEIFEILEDHKEMIMSAQEEGVTDEELISKFGNPDKVAKDLSVNSGLGVNVTPVLGEGDLEGYELVQSLPCSDGIRSIEIALVSEDFLYLPYEGDYIEVYAKGKFDEDDYEITFNKLEFVLKRKSGKKSRGLLNMKKTPDLGVRVPISKLEEFKLSIVSGDAKIKEVNAKKVTIKSTSGDVIATNISSNKDLSLSSVSGDTNLTGVNALGVALSSVSGDLEMAKVRLEEELSLNVVSGDVSLHDVECPEVTFKSVSGDLIGKEVYCDSVKLKSVSGDINISNSDKERHIEVKSKKTLSGKVTIN